MAIVAKSTAVVAKSLLLMMIFLSCPRAIMELRKERVRWLQVPSNDLGQSSRAPLPSKTTERVARHRPTRLARSARERKAPRAWCVAEALAHLEITNSQRGEARSQDALE
jgi:hypothetical protein